MTTTRPYAPEACYVDDPCSQEAADWALTLWGQGQAAGVAVDYVPLARACLVVVRVRREIAARREVGKRTVAIPPTRRPNLHRFPWWWPWAVAAVVVGAMAYLVWANWRVL